MARYEKVTTEKKVYEYVQAIVTEWVKEISGIIIPLFGDGMWPYIL